MSHQFAALTIASDQLSDQCAGWAWAMARAFWRSWTRRPTLIGLAALAVALALTSCALLLGADQLPPGIAAGNGRTEAMHNFAQSHRIGDAPEATGAPVRIATCERAFRGHCCSAPRAPPCLHRDRHDLKSAASARP